VAVYEDRSRLLWIAGGLLTIPVLWLGFEQWGSGNAFRRRTARRRPTRQPGVRRQPALKVVENFVGMLPVAAVVGVVLAIAVVLLARRRAGVDATAQRAALGLAVLGVAWLGLVAVMTVRGFSGNQRYLVVPAALLIILGAAGVVWAARALLGGDRARALPAAAAAVAALALAAVFVAPDADLLRPTLRGIEYQADLYHDLGTAIERAGGAERLKACGHAFTGPFLVPQVAWRLGVHMQQVDLEPERPPSSSTCAPSSGPASRPRRPAPPERAGPRRPLGDHRRLRGPMSSMATRPLDRIGVRARPNRWR
jgi:hypothetical protein